MIAKFISCRVLVFPAPGGGYVAQGLDYDVVVQGKNWEQTERAFLRVLVGNLRLRHDSAYAKKHGIETKPLPLKEARPEVWAIWRATKAKIRTARREKIIRWIKDFFMRNPKDPPIYLRPRIA